MNITGHFNSTVSHARDFIDVCTGLGDRWERTSARLTSLAMKTLGAMSYALAAWDTTVAVICLGSGASIPVALLYFAFAAFESYLGNRNIEYGRCAKEVADPGSSVKPFYSSAIASQDHVNDQENSNFHLGLFGISLVQLERA